jgi:tryptophanyl-tRNA synthetase
MAHPIALTAQRLQQRAEPSLEDMARDAGEEATPYGLLGYPVLDAADILCVKANAVPVGTDNAAHVEVTGEIPKKS